MTTSEDAVQAEAAPARSTVVATLSALRHDLPASLVVFLVALPLCLGIAVASGAPPLAGIVTGVVGGILVSWLSGSHIAVSGPAAGLTVVVLAAIGQLGYEGMLLATCLAGLMQIAFGALRAGVVAHYVPSAVIKGMLASIGLILMLKQIPHAIGLDTDFEGDEAFAQLDGRNTLTEIPYALGHFHVGATILAALGLVLLVVLDKTRIRERLRWLPPPLLVVALGVLVNAAFAAFAPWLEVRGALRVDLPDGGLAAFAAELSRPDLAMITRTEVWTNAITIAVIASLETLLCVEAMDRLDPAKRTTPTHRELVAQGAGNLASGVLGGLPITAVIVRGSVNVQAGARTRMSAFVHGLWLLAAVLLLPQVIRLVPLAALAAVLLHVGYRLSPIGLYRSMLRQPLEVALPFVVTVLGVLVSDLLKGVGAGLFVAVFFALLRSAKASYAVHRASTEGGREHVTIRLGEHVSFFCKARVRAALRELPDGCRVEIDARSSAHLHPDVVELIHELAEAAKDRGIEVMLSGVPERSAEAPAH